MDDGNDTLHIVVLPWLAFGHLTPFLELSTRIARLGHRVSFVSTPNNLRRLPAVPPDVTNLLRVIPLPLPPVDGLPAAMSATVDLPDGSLRPNLTAAFDALEPHLTAVLRCASPPPDWILFDYSPYWIPRVAREIGACSAFFAFFNATVMSILGPPSGLMGNAWNKVEQLTAPPEWIPFPTSVAFKPHEARVVFCPATDPDPLTNISEFNRFGASIDGCDIVAVRSTVEFEPEWLELLPELYKKNVIPVGHFPPPAQDSGDDKWTRIFNWMDKQPHGSVVYAAFGSEVRFSAEQLYEIARGLELSGLPFVWVLRRSKGGGGLPEGFEERTGGRGVVCEGWVPQVRMLGHQAVGGFLTHCGWNSVVEGLQFGLALVLLPMVFDQGLNARLLEEKGVGAEVPREEPDGRFDGAGIARTMRLVMVEDEGQSYRAKAREFGTVLGDGELHRRYVKHFVEYLVGHRPLRVSAGD